MIVRWRRAFIYWKEWGLEAALLACSSLRVYDVVGAASFTSLSRSDMIVYATGPVGPCAAARMSLGVRAAFPPDFTGPVFLLFCWP